MKLNIVEKLKKFSNVSTLDEFLVQVFNYESLHSSYTSYLRLSKDIVAKTINQTNWVPITFGVLIPKEENSELMSLDQNDLRQRNKHVKIEMDSGTSFLMIHESIVSKTKIELQGSFHEAMVHNG